MFDCRVEKYFWQGRLEQSITDRQITLRDHHNLELKRQTWAPWQLYELKTTFSYLLLFCNETEMLNDLTGWDINPNQSTIQSHIRFVTYT